MLSDSEKLFIYGNGYNFNNTKVMLDDLVFTIHYLQTWIKIAPSVFAIYQIKFCLMKETSSKNQSEYSQKPICLRTIRWKSLN